MSDRRAIVIGHQGQDGQLLTRLLLDRGDGVLGIGHSVTEALGGVSPVEPVALDQPQTIANAVRAVKPDEVYYLAAHHESSQGTPAADLYAELVDGQTVNVSGLSHFLEATRLHAPEARLFFACSSLVFGANPSQTPQDEATPMAPEEPYGWQKALARSACHGYRRRHGVRASVGLLYNHESALRSPHFLSMKIIRAAVLASRGATEQLVLGNLHAAVDWGYAPDFVEAFTRIVALETPDDFVVATGQAHTVQELAALAFGHLGLDWQRHVTVDPTLLTRAPGTRIGNSNKLRALTGWAPTVSFDQMVRLLVDQVAAHLELSPMRVKGPA